MSAATGSATPRALILAASLGLSCGGGGFARETTASNARPATDDPWFNGEPCAEVVDDAGLRIEEVEPGVGRAVGKGESVRVHYTAASPNGPTLHDTRDGGPPIEIIIGSTKTICGFERALLGMRAGAQRRVFVPWRLAFGEGGRQPDIQPRADLVLVIDLFLPADVVSEQRGGPVRPAMPGRRR